MMGYLETIRKPSGNHRKAATTVFSFLAGFRENIQNFQAGTCVPNAGAG